MMTDLFFWKIKGLEEMTHAEWESLCDGCGKCCLHKIEDEDDGHVYYTDVACRLLDLKTCRCLDYENRLKIVKDCLSLTPTLARSLLWLPETCAYRRLAEGKELSWWHPLVSNNSETVRLAHISICGKAVSELQVDMDRIEERVITWID